MSMQDRWDLSYMYESFDDPKMAADLASVPGLIEDAKAALAAELPPKEKLEALVDAMNVLEKTLRRLGEYAWMTLATDAMNARAAQIADKVEVLENEARLVQSGMQRYVGAVENLDAVIASSEKLSEVAFAIREMAEEARHTIPAEIEPWILQMSLSGGSAFSQLRDKLDSTHLVSFRGEDIPLSAARAKAYDPDPAVRKEAYEAEIASYAKMELPMSYCLNSIKQEAITLSKAKGYDSVLDMTLATSRMDRETLDALWTAVREYLPHFRRYLKAKARLLGHEDGLPFYDLFAPVGKSSTYTIEEAHDKLLQEMGKFTPEMAEFMDNAFKARWIDVYPRPGKTGGAFCSGSAEYERSNVLTNFQGSFSDVSTLAHELGHAWHNRCMKGLPAMLRHYPMPLAETASIFNETMLSYQCLSSCQPEEELNLLESGLMESTQTVVDIYSRFLFEQEVVNTRPDHAMTVDELKDAMLRAQEASYGDGLQADCRHPYMWACKSHYYSSGLNFYNFPYAFGLLFGKGVFAQWLEKGADFVPTYNQLLRSCGSDTVVNVAASVGIDVRSVDFWRSSLEVIKKDIDRFCELCEK